MGPPPGRDSTHSGRSATGTTSGRRTRNLAPVPHANSGPELTPDPAPFVPESSPELSQGYTAMQKARARRRSLAGALAKPLIHATTPAPRGAGVTTHGS